MQKRIEEFIKIATERNGDMAMTKLYHDLVVLCAEDERKTLHAAWNALANKKALDEWDERFLEETINPTKDKVSESPSYDAYRSNMHAGGLASMQNSGFGLSVNTAGQNYQQYMQAMSAQTNQGHSQSLMQSMGMQMQPDPYVPTTEGKRESLISRVKRGMGI